MGKKRNKGRIKLWVIIFFTALATETVIFAVRYSQSHATFKKYNDWWIQDRPLHEIEERYGEFDVCYQDKAGYFIYTDSASGIDYYYIMEYDPKDRVRKIYIGPWSE